MNSRRKPQPGSQKIPRDFMCAPHKFRDSQNRGSAARLSEVAFLEANFQAATREQRIGWFGTSDPAQFKRDLKGLYAKALNNPEARRQLDEMVGKVRDHVLKLSRSANVHPSRSG